MGKIKNLLKKSTNIGASALLLVSTLLPILALHGETTVSAANATTTLNPGGTVDTGNHTWTLGDFQTPGNFTPVGKIRVEQAGHLYQPMILELIREIQVHGSLLMGQWI